MNIFRYFNPDCYMLHCVALFSTVEVEGASSMSAAPSHLLRNG